MLDEIKLLESLEKRARMFDADGNPIGAESVYMSVREAMDMVRRQAASDAPLPGLGALSWSKIKEAAGAGVLQELLPSGTVLPCVLANGDDVGLIVGYNRSGTPYFIFRRAMGHLMQMDDKGGFPYRHTTLARYAEVQVYPMLPQEIQDVARKMSSARPFHLFCLSAHEVAEGPQRIDIFKGRESLKRAMSGTGSPCTWWLSNPMDNEAGFGCVAESGELSRKSATDIAAVVLAFTI